jgi:nucleoside-diphosphate-sugar epimerase
MKTLLITGHQGLIGRHISPLLEKNGYKIKGIDLKDNNGDITNASQLQDAISDCHGIIHLAAVSRVVWAEKDPAKCWKTNALASQSLLKIVSDSSLKPWVLMASSREIYGEQSKLPVHEDATLRPINIYGAAKYFLEKETLEARNSGINTAIVRFANVYGCIDDHADRVLPAFCRNAVESKPLRIDGFDHLFDFTHIEDTAKGVLALVEQLDAGERNLPAIHLLPGIGTTLYEAAGYALKFADSTSKIYESASRNYDVCRFIGKPERAYELLDWKARITPEQGINMLVKAFQSSKEGKNR